MGRKLYHQLKHLGISVFFMLFSFIVYGTHNRAGEITYRQLSGYQFEVTVTTYTYTKSSANHYRDSLLIEWGDSTRNYIHRIKTPELLPDDYQKNTYRRVHSYSGPGVFVIVMQDPNRNDGIRNIPNSVEQMFTIATTLRISADGQGNNTPLLLNPPIDKAAKGRRFIHNPAAYDADGDSLSFKLTVCNGQNGMPVEGYTFPSATKEFYVNATTGDLVWDAPTETGNYNVAMLIEEWRNGLKIGKIVRDMQIEVKETNNMPPVLQVRSPYCVRCGDSLQFMVSATDPNKDGIRLTATGGPLLLANNAARFTAVDSTKGIFTWKPSCAEVRKQPYLVVFKASDKNAEISLVDEKFVAITVIGHPAELKNLTPNLNSISVLIDTSKSKNADSFDIYRSTQASNYVPDSCATGMPRWLNYRLVASRGRGASTTFVDNDSMRNLTQGYNYCYRVVSRFADGAESYVSAENCVPLMNGLPAITHTSVLRTADSTGKILLRWSPARGLEETRYPKPWSYTICRKLAQDDGNNVYLYLFTTNDTMFVDSGLNTASKQYVYDVTLLASLSKEKDKSLQSPWAESIFLSAKPADRKVELKIVGKTPWTNQKYVVYRRSDENAAFDSIGFSTSPRFVDSTVQNLLKYTYRIKSIGQYGLPGFPRPLENFSQQISIVPLDTVAPLPLAFVSISQRCDSLQTVLQWHNLRRTMPQAGVDRYRIYSAPCRLQPYSLLHETNSADDTCFVRTFSSTDRSMSGCYYITAVDAAGNESIRAHDSCFYACPSYELANIFTPNGDGQNDLYIPVKNRFVDSVDFQLFDRWGGLVFRTANPQINWDGYNAFTRRALTDGVFFYTCDVFERWLDCSSQHRDLTGYIHKFSDGKQPDMQPEEGKNK